MMIDLTNVTTKVQLVKACYDYLIGMENRCINHNDVCAYTLDNSSKEAYEASNHCVVGALIPFENYIVEIEGNTVRNIQHVLPFICQKYVDVLVAFQHVHDSNFATRYLYIRIRLCDHLEYEEYAEVFGFKTIDEISEFVYRCRNMGANNSEISSLFAIHPDSEMKEALQIYIDTFILS